VSRKIVVLISGSGSNLQAIIDACERGEIDGKIVAVISNKPDAFGLMRAQKSNIPALVVNHQEYADRVLFDQALAKVIDDYNPDLIVLAGFMRILSAFFIRKFEGRLLNIHPSLLPKYTGLHTHKRALENGDKFHGATVHFVTEELDGGPMVVQSRIEILQHDSIETLSSKVAITEWLIYPLAVKWFCIGALKMSEEQVWLDSKLVKFLKTTSTKGCIDKAGQKFNCDIIVNNIQEYDNAKDIL